jgi:hypothetical protein
MVLGVLLIAASVGLAFDLVIENSGSIDVVVFGHSHAVSPGWLFVTGCAAAAVALLGLAMVTRGMSRARRRRSDLTESIRVAEGLKAERDRLAAVLDAERIGHSADDRAVPSVRVVAPTARALATTRSGAGA